MIKKIPKKRITVDKVPSTGQFRVQIVQGENFLGKRTFNKRKDADEFAKKQKKKRY